MATIEASLPSTQGLFDNQELFDNGCDSNSSSDEGADVSGSISPSNSQGNSIPNEDNAPIKPKRKPRAERISKPKKSEIRRMHSEIQRLIRESSINLPKYQPKVKTLDSFLAKLKSSSKSNVSDITSSNERENTVPDPISEEIKSVTNDSIKNTIPEPHPLSNDIINEDTSEADHTSLSQQPPKLHSFVNSEPEVKPEATPIEELKTRFVKHATMKSASQKPKKPIVKEDTLDTPTVSLISEDEASQPGLAPGAIRLKLKQKLQKQISKLKAQDRKLQEERRKMDEEEMEGEEEGFDELSKLEAQLDEDEEYELSEGEENSKDCEGSDDDDEGSDGDDEESDNGIGNDESDAEGPDDIDSEGSNSDEDEVNFSSSLISKRKRFIESDDDDYEDRELTERKPINDTSETSNSEIKKIDDPQSNSDISHDSRSHDSNKESHDPDEESNPIPLSMEDASMGPLIFNEGTIDHMETLDYPIVSRIMPHPLNEDSQQTEVANEDDIDLEMSYQIGPSLPPPHQEPVTGIMTPSVTRQSSSFSDKDVLRGLEAHPLRMPTQLLSNPEGIMAEEETQFLDANGFLCIRDKSKIKSPFSAIKQLTDMDSGNKATPSTQQLMEFSSGTSFKLKPNDNNSKKPPSSLLLDSAFDDTTNEVIGLCSGAFPSTAVPSSIQHHNERSSSSSSEDEEMMPTVNRKRRRKIKKPKSKDRLLEFVESEAELSGSDIGEDDEEDVGGVSEDTYDDEGEGSDVPLSDSELKDQVNQVHLKQLVVDDKAEIRKIQERFLLEGDLFEDGMQMKNGFFRTRKFIHGSETSQDLFAEERNLDVDDEDGSMLPLSSQNEAKRRKERLEKEEFIQRNTENCSLLEYDEDSHSILGLIKETSNNACTPSTTHMKSFTTPVSAVINSASSSHKKSGTRGSFLKHKTLDKFINTPQSSGTGSGRGYVFQTGVTNDTENKAKVLSSSNHKPQNKRPCYNRTISLPSTSSLFDKLK